MTDFIDLGRRFRELTEAELEDDAERMFEWADTGFGPDIGWQELLEHKRVILLAQAGAGKTEEMREQKDRLAREDKFAFYIPIERLHGTPVGKTLPVEEEERFEQWKKQDNATGWFLLDAVDELKLTRGSFDQALIQLSRAIQGHLHRVRIIVSSRPSDWRPKRDLAVMQRRLPVPPVDPKPRVMAPEEAFLERLERKDSEPARSDEENEVPGAERPVRTLAMLALTKDQIRRFAERNGVADADAFLEEIGRQNAWPFAGRPLDLGKLIGIWIHDGRLGTRAEQHERNATAKLRNHPDRPDQDALADDRARRGAERLALALALTRTRSIQSPDQEVNSDWSESALDAAKILSDWNDAERNALLRRGLFDPATYGRVRFHHRSVQEYLSAKQLQALVEKGMSTKALFRLLFGERYGEKVVFPSMRAIAAWLALWNPGVRGELIIREPETLLSSGDPVSLELSVRKTLLRAFAAADGRERWRGLCSDIHQIRRFAHPDFALVIRECWEKGAANQEVRELLIQMIQLGPVVDCADLAHAVAMDTEENEYVRIYAVRTLLACGREDRAQEFAGRLLADPAFWPGKRVAIVAGDLFPEILAVGELIELMERSYRPKRDTGDFHWVSKQIVEKLEPWSETAVALREEMSALIWRNRTQNEGILRFDSTHDYLAPALAVLCERQLREKPNHLGSASTERESRNDLVRSCVIAVQFGADAIDGRATVDRLRAHFKDDTTLRSAAFGATLALVDEVDPDESDWLRFHFVQQDCLAGGLTENDRSWLETALADEGHPEQRAVALYALILLWDLRGQIVPELDGIRVLLKGDTRLDQILQKHMAPPEPKDNSKRMERNAQRRKRNQECRKRKRLQHWTKWREELLANPDSAFSTGNRDRTLWHIYQWFDEKDHSGFSFLNWDRQLVEQAFSADIADRALTAFKEYWRSARPTLWSAQSDTERGQVRRDCILGISGVSAESEMEGWTKGLSSQEARLATSYATMNLNGFPSFIDELVKSHPAEVCTLIGEEVGAELALGACHQHLPTLQKLAYAESSLKQLVILRLICELNEWPHSIAEGSERHWPKHLYTVLRILEDTKSETDRKTIARECEERYRADPGGTSALAWLQGLFRFDAVQGAQALGEGFADREDAGTCERAIEAFAALFGGRDATALEIADPDQRARVLGQLVRQAYAFVRPEDDQVHESTYSPDTRDNAESARNFLLSSLIDTPGPKAWQILRELAEEDAFARSRVRLRFHAWERAATDAEFAPYESKNVAEFYTRLEMPPTDRDGLLAVMTDRLEDLAHDLQHHDFSIRKTLRGIEDEPEMQKNLAWWLEQKTNGVYRVAREEEVADRKRTDIRLLSTVGDQKAAIEVKIADHWSVNELEQALENQLVKRYLRHVNCKAGCLLLTYRGKKKYWIRPGTKGKRMAFGDVVLMLEETAQNLEDRNPDDFRIAVFGLDLTSPESGKAGT